MTRGDGDRGVVTTRLSVVDQLKLDIGAALFPENGTEVVVFVVRLRCLLELGEELFQLLVHDVFKQSESPDTGLEEQVSQTG